MPMTVNDYLAHFVNQLHDWYGNALAGLSDEQFYYQPNQQTNHIAFQAWHFLRTKDNVFNFVLQNRKTPVWLRQELNDKWNLPKAAQGTGMDPAEAHALRLPSIEALVQYGNDVHADVMPYLESVSGDDLQEITKLLPWGELPRIQHIGQTIIAHGNQHLGQINVLRVMQGLSGEDM